MVSKFKKCYLFIIEGENTKGRNTAYFEMSINEFIKTFPDLFTSLINSDEQVTITVGKIDCDDADNVPFHTCLNKIQLDKVTN